MQGKINNSTNQQLQIIFMNQSHLSIIKLKSWSINTLIYRQTKKNNDQNEKIQKFREDFAKIEAATEIENFDELLRIFTEN